jgi:hypothetical protein
MKKINSSYKRKTLKHVFLLSVSDFFIIINFSAFQWELLRTWRL